MNEKLNRIRLSSDEVKKLRQQGVIKAINENNHDLDYVLTVSSKSSTLQIPKRSIQTIIIEKH